MKPHELCTPAWNVLRKKCKYHSENHFSLQGCIRTVIPKIQQIAKFYCKWLAALIEWLSYLATEQEQTTHNWLIIHYWPYTERLLGSSCWGSHKAENQLVLISIMRKFQGDKAARPGSAVKTKLSFYLKVCLRVWAPLGAEDDSLMSMFPVDQWIGTIYIVLTRRSCSCDICMTTLYSYSHWQ